MLDPYTKPDSFANAFDRVNLYAEAIASYKIGDLPGRFASAFNWSNKPTTDLAAPFGALTPAQVPQAVAVLVGNPPPPGLPIRYNSDTLFVIANLSQYLLVLDDSQQIDAALKSGQALRGIGIFARGGWGPAQSNPVTGHMSAGLFVQGLLESRKYDSFGVGYYCNFISSDLKNSLAELTAGTAAVRDEQGVEVFYSYAVTPAIRLIASYQHIWDPFAAQVAANNSAADLFQARLTIAW